MGRANQVGVGLQPDGEQKVAAAGPSMFLPLTTAGMDADISVLEHVAMEGDRFPSRGKRGGRAYGGDFEGGIRPVSTGILFTMAFGEPVSSVQPDATNAPTVYRHTWRPKAAGKRPMPATSWLINNDIYEDTGNAADKVVDEYIGTMLNELAWNTEGDEYLLFTGGMMAIRNLEDVAAPVSTLDQTELWSFDEVGAEISVPSIAAGAYAPVALYSWEFNYSNDFQGGDRFQLGSKEIVRLRPGNVESTITAAFAEDLEAHYRRAIADQPELVKLRFNAKGRLLYDAVLAANDLYESLSIEFSALEYTSGGRPMEADSIWEDTEVEANVVKDGSGNFLEVVLTNEHNGSDYVAP